MNAHRTSEGRARDVARVQPRWERSGPLPAEVREKLAGGFGARVRALRAEHGWSQRRLAEVVGCDARTVGRLERGEHRPSRQQIAWLARAFTPAGVDPFPLDFELLNLVGENRRHRRRGSRSGLYELPSELGAALAEADRQRQRLQRLLVQRSRTWG
ncbi:helix-turn-helix transcriptional regulator [Actinosynnema sp. NPDC023587]|uniref:helix-turn-helix domain-containing protein n=1 Tax=Actinosynnema sp. NPDC023587 TaxID=3154695 RepID=UPI0033D0971B